MLDVHPPHHPTHTWRDFFIHIATIVVGLLIAVCLEQGVETIHRHHERRQLIEDLRQEAEGRNRVIRENNQAYAQFEDWLRNCLHAALSATPSNGTVSFVIPAQPATTGNAKPETAVWSAAKSSGTISVLSRRDIEGWERVDYFAQLSQRDAEALRSELQSIEAIADHLGTQFTPGTTVQVTTQGRDELTRAMGTLAESIESVRHDNEETASASLALLSSTKSLKAPR